MKKGTYTEEKIIRILNESDSGMKVPDLCRKYGMSDATFYNWKNKYSGMNISDIKRLKTLEDENRRLKKLVAEQALDMQVLKEINEKNF